MKTTNYSPACDASTQNVVIGRLDDLRESGEVIWSDAACAVGDSGDATLTLSDEGDYFFLVSGSDDLFLQGSYGADSDGRPRPTSSLCGQLLTLAEPLCGP